MEALADSSVLGSLAGLGWIDRIALGVVVLACLRGLWIGLLREAFSIGALAAAFVAIRLWTDPTALWLLRKMPFDIALSARSARLAAGALLALAALFVVVALGGFVLKRVRETGLGLLDRLLGGALGVAEGALLAGIALIGLVALVGPDHEVLRGSRSVALLSEARALASGKLPDVAAPPPERPEAGDSASAPQADGRSL